MRHASGASMIAHNLLRIGSSAAGGGKRRRVLFWLMLSAVAVMLGWFGFRGYLNPELLFHFANSLYC
jgi:hypothetical protein